MSGGEAHGFLLLTLNGVEVVLDGDASGAGNAYAARVVDRLAVECVTLPGRAAGTSLHPGAERDVFLVLRIASHGAWQPSTSIDRLTLYACAQSLPLLRRKR